MIVTLPILGKTKALNPDAEFSAVMNWLPEEVLGANELAWRCSAVGLHLFARVA